MSTDQRKLLRSRRFSIASFISGILSLPFVFMFFRRGDASGDGRISLRDAVDLLFYLFRGRDVLACEKAADADDSGTLGLDDAVHILMYLFKQGPKPAAPFAACGFDTTADLLDCRSYEGCPEE